MTFQTDLMLGGLLIIAGVTVVASGCSFFKNKSRRRQQQQRQQQQEQEQQKQQQQLLGGSTIVAVEPIATPGIEGNTPPSVELLKPSIQAVRISENEKAVVVETFRRFSTMVEMFHGPSSVPLALLFCSQSFAEIEASFQRRPGEGQVRKIISPMGTFVKTILRAIIRNEHGCVTEALQKETAKLAEQYAIACRVILGSINTGRKAQNMWPGVVVDPILRKRTSLLKATLQAKRESQQRQEARSCFSHKTATATSNNSPPVVRSYSGCTTSTAALSSPFSSGTSPSNGSSSSFSSSSFGGGGGGGGGDGSTASLTRKTSSFHLRRVSVVPGTAFVAYRSPLHTANPRGTSLSGAGAVVGQKVTKTTRRPRTAGRATSSTPFVLG